MKISEIVTEQYIHEGPLDFAKKIGAGLKGMAQGTGFKSGYRAKRAQITRRDDLKNNVDFALGNWAQTQSAIQSSGKVPTVNDVVNWAKNYFKDASIPTAPGDQNGQPFTLTGSPASVKLNDVKSWLTQQWQSNYATAATSTPTPTPPTPPELSGPAPTIPDLAKVNTNQGIFTYDDAAKVWQNSAGVAAPAEYTAKLTQMWQDQNKITAAVQFPVRDVPGLVTTNAGTFDYSVNMKQWYQNGSPVTNNAVVQRLNELARDLKLGQS